MRNVRKSILAMPHSTLGAMGESHALRSLRPNRRQMDRQEVRQPDEKGALTISRVSLAPAPVETAGIL
jgi:hypothetical protein